MRKRTAPRQRAPEPVFLKNLLKLSAAVAVIAYLWLQFFNEKQSSVQEPVAEPVLEEQQTIQEEYFIAQAEEYAQEEYFIAHVEEPDAVIQEEQVVVLSEKQLPSSRELSQPLRELIDVKGGWRQSGEFFKLLTANIELINEFTLNGGELNSDWSLAFHSLYMYAIRTARDYGAAKQFMTDAWTLLDNVEDSEHVFKAKLNVGLHLTELWVRTEPFEISKLYNQLETMARERGGSGLWPLKAPFLQQRFIENAHKVPEEYRESFIQRHRRSQEILLMDETISPRIRSKFFQIWVGILARENRLAEALPVIDKWEKRYGKRPMEMSYYYARMLVELFEEGDWEKAEQTVRRATRDAGGPLFDERQYTELINLFYDLQWLPGYELQRLINEQGT